MRHGECVHTETDEQGVKYELFIQQDDMDVRGNAMASGDDDEDKRVEDEIIEALDNGNVWAWAQTTCRASFEGFEGFDYLGGCSYTNTKQFIQPDGYWPDMMNEAKHELVKAIERIVKAGKFARAQRALARLTA